VDVLVKLSDSMTSSIFYDTLPTKVDQYTMKPFVRGPYSSVDYLGTSVNSISATKNYIYYYDGKFIAAYYKNNGKLAKLDSIIGKTQNFQQGIVADNCGNVIVGADSGRIRVYYFNGTNFQLKKQITIFPNSKRCVLDLAYDKDRNLIVFSGDSMAGTIINPVNCESSKATEFYVYPNKRCSHFAFAQVKFADTTKSYTFTWYDSTTNKVIRKIPNTNSLETLSTIEFQITITWFLLSKKMVAIPLFRIFGYMQFQLTTPPLILHFVRDNPSNTRTNSILAIPIQSIPSIHFLVVTHWSDIQ
jgi:hypothetical protein